MRADASDVGGSDTLFAESRPSAHKALCHFFQAALLHSSPQKNTLLHPPQRFMTFSRLFDPHSKQV